MYEVYALKYAERETTACQFFYREASHDPLDRNVERRQPTQIITHLPQMLAAFDTIDALAGDPGRVVAGHDPLVAERFEVIEPGVVRIA